MTHPPKQIDHLVNHLFRHEAGKLVSILTCLFGPVNIALAEDIVQDTLLAALDHWSTGDIPDNPAAWLTQVAKRKAINELNRRTTIRKHHTRLGDNDDADTQRIDEIFLDTEIEDSQLRMIFTCCHPALPLDSQIPLTLKSLCGFSTKEIAQALLTNESTIHKRLYRARKKIRTNDIPFSIPVGSELKERVHAVSLTLYLMFNEGYNSSHSESLIRKDLCLEALRLTRILADRFSDYPGLYALLALMCFHAARFDARLDMEGAIIIFKEQDRSLWNRKLIAEGFRYLKKSSSGDQLTVYHLEAGIAAEHCLAGNFEKTDWQSICRQYELLLQLKKNPIIKLNMIIVKSQIDGIDIALDQLHELAESKELENYYLLPVTQGIFYMQKEEYQKAKSYLMMARNSTESIQEIQFLEQKIGTCNKYLE